MDDGADDAGRRNRLEFSAGEGPKPKLSIALTGPEPNLHRLGFGVDRGHERQLRLLLLLVLLVDADRVNPEAGALISGAELLQSLQQALADLEPLVVERYGSAWLRIRAPAIRESAVSCRGGASNGSDLEGALYIRNIVSKVELDNADLALIDWAVLEVENCALPNLVLALDMRRRWWFTRFCSFSGVCQTDGWLVLFAKYPASPTLRCARGLAPLLSEWKALTDIRPPSYLHVAPGFLFSVHFFFFHT